MRLLLLVALLQLCAPCFAVQVQSVRTWPDPDGTRVVFDVSGRVEYHLFTMKNPNRVVIDLHDASTRSRLRKGDAPDPLLKGIRHARRHRTDLRVVLDLTRAAEVQSFEVPPNREYGQRLVIDLKSKTPIAAKKPEPVVTAPAGKPREVLIAIDPGHGGEDSGARGPDGTCEKNVVLKIARKLAALVNATPGMRALLTRKGDYYVGLRRRMQIAREHKADLFVSIHADAFRDHRVSGSSVYVLSRHGASSEAARLLADRENASDYIGGVSLQHKGNVLASVLLDLSQTATQEASIDAARDVLQHLDKVGDLHKGHVQHAAFVVLKSPDVPSMLVETAYISNPRQERKLRTGSYQEDLAKAILGGVKEYFNRHAPPGTILALRNRRRLEHREAQAEARRGAPGVRVANNNDDEDVRPGQDAAVR